ncbi:hypothetical protein ACFQY4_41450 [Catellatospora bangladeshensis]
MKVDVISSDDPAAPAELPVRAPQTHLAAPLRAEPVVPLRAGEPSGEKPPRPAERTRNFLTSLLAGAHRGRTAATVPAAPPNAADSPTVVPTPEEPTP